LFLKPSQRKINEEFLAMRVKMKKEKGEKREVERGEGGLKRRLEVMLLYREAM